MRAPIETRPVMVDEFASRLIPWAIAANVTPLPEDQQLAEAEKLRSAWPELREGTPDELATAASVARVEPGVAWLASSLGTLRFCHSSSGVPSFVLVSECGRFAAAFRMDGEPWKTGHGFYTDSRRLPGSLDLVEIGAASLDQNSRAIAIVFTVADYLPALALIAARAPDCGVVCIPSAGYRVSARLLSRIAGRPVRFFTPDDSNTRLAVAPWAADLVAAGVYVDGFDFAECGVLNVAGLAALPLELQPAEVMS